MEDMTRIPPHSVESEQSILGSILLDKEAIITVSETINPDDFYKEAHKIIYESMIKLSNKSEPIDLITLTEELKKQGHLDDVGGISYITSLSTIVPTTSNVKYYADIVKEKSVLRKLIKVSNDIINLGYDGSTKIEDVLEVAEKKIFDISQEKTSDDFKSINSVLMDTYDMIEHLYTNKSEITGITTGFRDLNKKINGMQRTDLLLIAARPAMGKTAFSLNLVQNAALKGDASVAVFSLEMSKEQLVQRMLSAQSNVELSKLKTGKLNENDWPRIIDAMAVLSNAKIHIDDTPGIKISELRSKCRKLKMEQGLDLILIDYLQLMEGEGNNESRLRSLCNVLNNSIPSGGTNIYLPLTTALEELKQYDIQNYTTSIILMTDGQSNEGSFESVQQKWTQEKSDIPIFSITFGDSDETQLQELANFSKARVFDGKKDLESAFKQAKGYN